MGVFKNPTLLKHDLKIPLGICFDQVLRASAPVPAGEAHQHGPLRMTQRRVACWRSLHASTTRANKPDKEGCRFMAEEEETTKAMTFNTLAHYQLTLSSTTHLESQSCPSANMGLALCIHLADSNIPLNIHEGIDSPSRVSIHSTHQDQIT